MWIAMARPGLRITPLIAFLWLRRLALAVVCRFTDNMNFSLGVSYPVYHLLGLEWRIWIFYRVGAFEDIVYTSMTIAGRFFYPFHYKVKNLLL